MRHISTTPFGQRPVTTGLLAAQALAEAPAPSCIPDKWALLRDLTAARTAFSVSDRDLAVLAALLSFHPGTRLNDDNGLIVFPSNASLSDRAHGMAESTLRRHLAALVDAGLILRRDSANGKRYARRNPAGEIDRAFGFDLRPLLVMSPDIAARAETARAASHALRCLREAVFISLRNMTKLILWASEAVAGDWAAYHQACADLQRRIRRKMDSNDLQQMQAEIMALTARIEGRTQSYQPLEKSYENTCETEEMGGNTRQNGRHYQNSKTDCLESEKTLRKKEEDFAGSSLPLSLVLKAAPDIATYALDDIHDWRDLVATAEFVRPMLGISADGWRDACQAMGPDVAAITLACILQRSDSIMKPGGYLRNLTMKAANAGFTPAPMIMALIRADNTKPL
ncbi:plasmid replication protein RepC [Paracoccus sp. JM45]|uniref:plasmid replication protein RepC n=1 Tax=Paracoccus sp. JM45 TaxID=2283626 RepID=UPI000E6CFAB3|nr:plasmid replication protein RepC [Paracoccus sp. JM45]RJE78604.1 replication initiation protein RepC [Paracoccus sp. JM45]